MKHFILGFIVAFIVGAWFCLAITGIISIKTAILIPIGVVIGFLFAIYLLCFIWDEQEVTNVY